MANPPTPPPPNDISPLLRLAMEEAARRGVRVTLPGAELPPMSFRDFIRTVSSRFVFYRHCEILIDVLQKVADGKIKRLMIFEPPRHGKSELVSRLFGAYWVYRYPRQWVGLCSYGADLAYTLSRAAQENLVRAGGRVKGSAGAVKHWETPEGGGFWAAGVGGPVTGKGFNIGILDDPLKNAQEASSDLVRERQKEWYASTFYTREEPNERGEPDGAIILVMTRWHELDLAGWLLAQEEDESDQDGSPEGWHIVNFPAISEAEADQPRYPKTCTVEPEFRQPGEALCPERRPLEKLNRIARKIGQYFFQALYQGRPRPREGGMFQSRWFPIVGAAPGDCRLVRWWDFAATQDGGDYTAGVLMGRSEATGLFYVLHVRRGQWSSRERNRIVKQTAKLDAHTYGNIVMQGFEQEGGSAGKDVGEDVVLMLAGYPVTVKRPTGSKEVRAQPAASQAEEGNILIVRDIEDDRWIRNFLDELDAFPTGRNDDQVDGLSGAFNELALQPDSGDHVVGPPRRDLVLKLY